MELSDKLIYATGCLCVSELICLCISFVENVCLNLNLLIWKLHYFFICWQMQERLEYWIAVLMIWRMSEVILTIGIILCSVSFHPFCLADFYASICHKRMRSGLGGAYVYRFPNQGQSQGQKLSSLVEFLWDVFPHTLTQ